MCQCLHSPTSTGAWGLRPRNRCCIISCRLVRLPVLRPRQHVFALPFVATKFNHMLPYSSRHLCFEEATTLGTAPKAILTIMTSWTESTGGLPPRFWGLPRSPAPASQSSCTPVLFPVHSSCSPSFCASVTYSTMHEVEIFTHGSPSLTEMCVATVCKRCWLALCARTCNGHRHLGAPPCLNRPTGFSLEPGAGQPGCWAHGGCVGSGCVKSACKKNTMWQCVLTASAPWWL